MTCSVITQKFRISFVNVLLLIQSVKPKSKLILNKRFYVNLTKIIINITLHSYPNKVCYNQRCLNLKLRTFYLLIL